MTFNRRMGRQRRRRREDGRPDRHPTASEAAGAVSGVWWRRRQARQGWCVEPPPPPGQAYRRASPDVDDRFRWDAVARTLDDLHDTDQIPDDPTLEDGAPQWWLDLQRQAGESPEDPPSQE